MGYDVMMGWYDKLTEERVFKENVREKEQLREVSGSGSHEIGISICDLSTLARVIRESYIDNDICLKLMKIHFHSTKN